MTLRRIYLSCIAGLLLPNTAIAIPETFITIRDNLFNPHTVTIPAGEKVKITFINEDSTPEEIDSFDLNREKVVFGNSRASIFVGPLPPGEYNFFGEFHPNTAVGKVIVSTEEATNAH